MCDTNGKCGSGWAEPLDPSCPPRDAGDPPVGKLYRLVGSIPPRAEDFHSYKKLGLPKGLTTTECQYSSVSLVRPLARCQSMLGLPRFRGNRVVRVNLAPGCGLVRVGSATHADWWPCAQFDPVAASVPEI
jgi:hypothetical protein